MAALPRQSIHAATDRRTVPRNEMSLGVTLHRVGEQEIIPAAIANLSATGFLAELPPRSSMPPIIDVDLPNAGRRQAQMVWQSGTLAGCNFLKPLGKADISAARLKSAHLDAPAPAPPQLAADDPVWDTANIAKPHEKWPLPARVAVIAAAAIAPWLPIAGIAALLA